MSSLTPGEKDYLKGIPIAETDPAAVIFLRAYRAEMRLKHAEEALASSVNNAASKIAKELREQFKAFIIFGVLSILGFTALPLFYFANIVFVTDKERIAGLGVADAFHTNPVTLAKSIVHLSIMNDQYHGYSDWLNTESEYFYRLWKANGSTRCPVPSTLNETNGCFFQNPVDLQWNGNQQNR